MSTSTATISNTSSRKTPGQPQKTLDKTRNLSAAETKPQPDDPAPKRPKRTLKLTASQRERKRAIDREAQRSIRLKTKNYIAHLENLVRIMENGGSTTNGGESAQHFHEQPLAEHGDERVRALLSQLRQREDEIKRLNEMLSGVQRLVGAALSPAEESASQRLMLTDAYIDEQCARSTTGLQGAAHDHFENSASTYSHSSDSSSPMVELGYLPFDPPRTAEAFAPNYTSRSFASGAHPHQQQDLYNGVGRLSAPAARPDPPTSEPVDAPGSREEGELFMLLDREVNRVLAGGHQSFTNQQFDEDIVVRAVLHGWRDVQDEYLLDKGWQALRSIDQSIFRECGVVERIAILYLMRLKLLHQSNTNPQYLAPLPPFFQRSPQEDLEVLKKTPIIEHFIWPGLRTCLCKNTKKYINNRFSDSFRHSFKFVWPCDISEAYDIDRSTQLYSITPEFKQRQWNLGSWTMRRDFFTNASELIGVIPIYEATMARAQIPARSLSMQTATNARQTTQKMHPQMAVSKVEESELDHSQIGLGQDTHHALAPPHMHGSEPTTATDIRGTHIPYSAEVEAWLGDPDLVPQYWNMSPGMEVAYEAAAHQWPPVQRGFVE